MRPIVLGLMFVMSTASGLAAQDDDVRGLPKGHAAARNGSAQDPEQPSRRRFQIGVGLKTTTTPGPRSSSSLLPEVMWRWRGKTPESSARFAPAFRMGSFSTEMSQSVAGTAMAVGDVHVRPLMVGVDYKRPRGRWQWSIGLAAGWAVNGVDVGQGQLARAAAIGAGDLWADVHNSLAWGPRVEAAYDMTDRVSIIMESSYVSTRPRLDVRANGRVSTSTINADALMLKLGIVYAIH